MIPKFRAYDEETEAMFDVLGFDLDDNEIWSYDQSYELNKCKIMQSTGLLDKNGVEIYEGDIVKRTYLFNGAYGETHTGEVVYDKEYAQYVISKPNKFIEPQTEALRNVLSDKSTYEVIGNVYENKKSLKEFR